MNLTYTANVNAPEIRIGRTSGREIRAVEVTFGARTVVRKFDDSRLAPKYIESALELLGDITVGRITADQAADEF